MPGPGLIRLDDDADGDVRRAVAANAQVPTEVLEKLAFDAEPDIRRQARNVLAKRLEKQIEADRER